MKIVLLADCSELIPDIADLWYQQLGKDWIPGASVEFAEKCFATHIHRNELPIAFVALDKKNKLMGIIALRMNDGVKIELTPWISDLVVDPNYQHQGIGEQLIDAAKQKAHELGYKHLYLFTLNPSLPEWYAQLGWRIIDQDQVLGKPIMIMQTDL